MSAGQKKDAQKSPFHVTNFPLFLTFFKIYFSFVAKHFF